MTVDETLRQHYLKEMGVTPWYPRFTIVGAGESHAYRATQVLPVAKDESVLVEVQTDVPQAAPTPVSTPTPAPAPASMPETSGADPQVVTPFAFTWLSLDARLSILVEQPSDQRGRLPVPLRDMLMRILKAMDPAFASVTPQQVFQFRWPFDRISATAGQEAAAQAVHGFMQQRLRQTPSRCLLMLVDGKPAWLPVADPGLELVQLPSLSSMKTDPSLKAPAWHTMQQLVVRLRKQDDIGERSPQ